MKFRDIQQYIQVGNYNVSYPLKYYVRWIEHEQEEAELELNPDFQRGHVWTRDQQISFIEYLLRGGKTNPIYFNCPHYSGGGIPDKGEFVCVDGLQRTTAILKFINNEIPAFGYYYNEYEDKLPSSIEVTVNVNELDSRAKVLQWYIEINSGGTPHTNEEIEKVKHLLQQEREVIHDKS